MSNRTDGHVNGKPRRPRLSKADARTPEEAAKYREYIEQLRAWLNSLSDEEHDRAIRKLTSKELDRIIMLDTYENYQKGGPLRKLLEGALIEGTL